MTQSPKQIIAELVEALETPICRAIYTYQSSKDLPDLELAKRSSRKVIDLIRQHLASQSSKADPIRQKLGKEAVENIATAPKDGSTILVYFKRHGWVSVFWGSPEWSDSPPHIWCVDDFKHGPYSVRGYSEGDDLAWQPLPPPPPSTEGEDA